MNYTFIIQTPYWFYFLAAVIAAAYAWLLYSKRNPWSKTANWALMGLRVFLVLAILFILSAPLLKQSQQQVDKPTIAILLDDSKSVANHTQNLQSLVNSIHEEHKNVGDDKNWVFYSLRRKISGDSLSYLKFGNTKTDLQSAVRNIEEDLEGQPVTALVILTDGNYNQGINPTYLDYKYPVYAVGLGDTLSKKDLSITGLQYNKTAYLGNKFQIGYKLKSAGFKEENIVVTLKERENVLHTKAFKVSKNIEEQSGSIILDAKQEGSFHYILSCTQKEGEYTFANNQVHLYIEVVKNKDKIVVLAQAPHPDVKAINGALSSGQNYDVKVHVVGDGQKFDLEGVNAAVLVGIPNKKGLGNELYADIVKRKIPICYILQNNSDFSRFNSDAKIVTINLRSAEADKSQASLNQKFESFNTSALDQDLISQFPPLNVPFANFSTTAGTEVLLYQKIGSSATANPLWVVGTQGGQKSAAILGDGLWMWRVMEKSKTQASTNFDDMMIKTIQYIAFKADQRKFKVTPQNQEYEEGDLVTMVTEVYDDLNQLSYGQEINLTVKNEKGKEFKYKYINQENNDNFEVGHFEEGSYRYTASTLMSGKNLNYSGIFNIKKLQLEELTSVADHQLLKDLSTKTKGRYFEKSEITQLFKELNALKAQGKVRLTESYSDLINLKWLLVLLLLLVSIEWFLRKYLGGY